MSDKHFTELPFDQTFKVGDVIFCEPESEAKWRLAGGYCLASDRPMGMTLPIDRIPPQEMSLYKEWEPCVVRSVTPNSISIERL